MFICMAPTHSTKDFIEAHSYISLTLTPCIDTKVMCFSIARESECHNRPQDLNVGPFQSVACVVKHPVKITVHEGVTLVLANQEVSLELIGAHNTFVGITAVHHCHAHFTDMQTCLSLMFLYISACTLP